MTDKDNYYFYERYVDASAAYIENEEGKIIARCVIYNKVTDDEGKEWRIDGYKQIGAGCSDSRAFVDIAGNSLSDKKFSIRCSVGYGETISYQDSFKYLYLNNEIAYNYPNSSYDVMLDSTEGQLEDDNEEYDAYHDEYCQEVTTVYYQGESTTCNSDRLHDFIYLDGEYYHEDDVSSCPHCGTQFVTDDGYYSELTERDYCCLDCKENDESANQTKEEFINDCQIEKFGYKEATGMITDVGELKHQGLPISVANISCGYYEPHTDNEFTVKADLLNCLALVCHIIENCQKTYPHKSQDMWSYDNDYIDEYFETESGRKSVLVVVKLDRLARSASLISQRTKQSLKAKRARGATLGKPENLSNNLEKAITNSRATCNAKALSNPNNQRAAAMIQLLIKENLTLTQIARRLNSQGFKTSQGGVFRGSQVRVLMEWYGIAP